VMRDAQFVQNPRVEDVRFTDGQVVSMKCVRKGDWAFCGEWATAKRIHGSKPSNVCNETQPVLRTEIVIDTAVIGILRVSYRVAEGKAADRVRKTIIPVTGQTIRRGTSSCESTIRIILVHS